jgi:hypothetical protein
MYYQVVSQCTENLGLLEGWLDKAEQYAASKKFDVEVLLNGRLAPDQKPFIYQVQSACDYIKGAAAWLSGEPVPKHPDTEKTVEDLRTRIRKTIEFVRTVKESQYAGAAERTVTLSWGPGKVLGGEDYLLQVVIPNVYFHLTTAYSVLRHNGIEVGKMDFLGRVNFVDP